ncbi:hypothetical protein AB0I28_02730 [Phytomonospora sp. NPDC050363]|uniref:hypothetical protein n=1 Tax=Phytomonospora sp. NPDC050363 TaxID=3155642 RepID=UPI0033CF0B84
MRESLSELARPVSTARPRRPAVYATWAAVALSTALAIAAAIDQAGTEALAEHARAVYEPYGKDPNPGMLYGLLFTVAAVDLALWLAVLPAARSRTWAPVLAITAFLITAGLALTLLVTAEYGETIFPPLWGALAALPAVAGVAAVALFLRRR